MTMESPCLIARLEEIIRTNDDVLKKCPDIAKEVQLGKLALVTLVERLGSVLTDTDLKIRSCGTEVLAEVMHLLPKDFLTEAELKYIAAFFVDRLIDQHTVVPVALKGILALIQMKHAPRDIASRVLKVMFQGHFQCQTLHPEGRRCVYKLFNFFIHDYTEEVKALGPDFVYGFISAIDQEKDARNLLIVFGMLPFFIETFPLGHLEEEMFEIISCYFPLDYRPEYSNSPVSREDLSEGLQKCLVSFPRFGKFCIPLLIEKLDSKLKLAKLDSFKVLISGCEVFSVDDIRTNLLDLWRIIQHEVLPGSDKEVRDLGLGALKAIVKRMSEGAIERKNPKLLTNVTAFVLSAGVNSLGEVELNLFLPAVRMMLTVAEASAGSCVEVVKKVLPVLIKQCHKECGEEQKVIVLRAVTSFIAVSETHDIIMSLHCPDLVSTLQEVIRLFLGAARGASPDVRKEGFHGLAVSVRILKENNRDILYELLNKGIDHETDESVRAEMLFCLKEISKSFATEVVERIVNIKLTEISEEDCFKHLTLVLESLCELADSEPFTSLIVPSILQLIMETSSLEKCTLGLKCLRRLLEERGNPKLYQYIYLESEVVTRLILWCLKSHAKKKYPNIFENEDVLCNTAKIINIIVMNQEERVHNEIVNVIMPQIINMSADCSNGLKFMPLERSSPWSCTIQILLLEALIGSLSRSIRIPDFSKVVMELVGVAIGSPHPLIHLSANRLSANLMNKALEDDMLIKLLEEVSEILQNALQHGSEWEKHNAVNAMMWITKALVMRNHPETKKWVEALLVLLAKPALGGLAAQGFGLIMADNVEYLKSENFCNIRILFRQRFFSFSTALIEAFHSANSDSKPNYLTALALMLQQVPQEVLLMNLEKMVPLLVESLQQKDEVLLSTTLDTLHLAMEKSDLPLQHHLQTFIPQFLVLTQFLNSMNVRKKALQCVHQICYYPVTQILPFKKQVIKVLGECLDDPKRLVRREAVQARSQWFLVGTNRKLQKQC